MNFTSLKTKDKVNNFISYNGIKSCFFYLFQSDFSRQKLNMRKTLLIFILFLFPILAIGGPYSYNFKMQLMGLKMLPLDSKNMNAVNPGYSFGGEFAVEFPSWGEYP